MLKVTYNSKLKTDFETFQLFLITKIFHKYHEKNFPKHTRQIHPSYMLIFSKSFATAAEERARDRNRKNKKIKQVAF